MLLRDHRGIERMPMTQNQRAEDFARREDVVEIAPTGGAENAEDGQSPRELYLDLMKKCLTRLLFPEKYSRIMLPKTLPRRIAWRCLQPVLARFQVDFVQPVPTNTMIRQEGLDWPLEAETMIGLKRLNNLEACITDVIRRRIPGDLIETGVWRGGASIFMRAVLKAYREQDRLVWLADSFQGLPKPNARKYPADAGDKLWKEALLAVPVEEVKENFRRYGLLDGQVRFLVGWFRDVLPKAPIERLAVLRLDGDMYESTTDALIHLYPKLSLGGYVIIDDYALPTCRAAVEDFRARHGVTEPLQPIDQMAKFWQRLT
jgi:O-methyltransferase